LLFLLPWKKKKTEKFIYPQITYFIFVVKIYNITEIKRKGGKDMAKLLGKKESVYGSRERILLSVVMTKGVMAI
jgi:hypothetical protein